MTTKIVLEKDVEVEKPLLMEGLAGIGHVGRNCVSFLAEKLEAEKIGELQSHHFPPYTIVNDNKVLESLKNDIYYVEINGKEVILIEGNAQASNNEGHYEIAEEVLDFAEEKKVEEIITIGGYGKGDVVEQPSVYGAVTDLETKEKFEDLEIDFDHEVGQIVGISGLLLGLGERRGMKGIALLGETPGFLLSDPKSTEAVLEVMEDYLDVDLDYSSLDDKVEESQEVLKKLQNLKQNQGEPEQSSDLGYIG